MSPSRIRAIAAKEVFHILRDPRTLVIIFLMPLLQLIIFGYAMNTEIRHVKLAVRDQSHSSASREIISAFGSTDYFRVIDQSFSAVSNQEIFSRRLAQAILILPHDLSEKMGKDRSVSIQLLLDASDANSAQIIQAYCQAVLASKYQQTMFTAIDVRTRTLYNPDLKSAYFFVPGLIAMILVMICALLTSISISREKELGTLEQVLVSPVSAMDVLLGKVIPYIALALMDAFIILAVGMIVFHVPFCGDLITFLIYTLLYVITALCLGLMISTLAQTQQAAMMMALAVTLLPTMMLSGFIFPIRSMPALLQKITYIVPARYYLQIIRGIMLKGNTIAQLWQSGLALGIISAVVLLVASRRFSLRIR